MDIKNINLTVVDRIVLNSYCDMLDGLSLYLGEHYEIVLHSLEDLDHSVIKIINGYHTGRNVGAPITDLAMGRLAKIEESPDNADEIVYFSRNQKGEPLKSATIVIRGERNRVIGLLCINCYLNAPLIDVIKSFSDITQKVNSNGKETYLDSSDEMISNAVDQVRIEVMSNETVPANLRNKVIIMRLHERGIFNLKNSVMKVAKVLGLSKNTVYLHLRNK